MYENPKDNPKRVDLLINYIDFLKTQNNDLIESKDSYEAFFYIAKLCSLIPTQNEYNIFVEKKIFHLFIHAFKSLYEKIEIIDFNNKTIEKDEPKLDKDFKESIFVYILYSVNILNKYFKDFGKFFLEDDYGLKSIVSFLNHQIFVDKNLNPSLNVFGNETRIIKLLIADLSGLIDDNDSLFKKKCQEVGFNLIESIFNIINKTETKSDVIYSAYLFLSTICSENEIGNGFNSILTKYENYLNQCVDDFKNKDPKTIERKSREIRYILDLYIRIKLSYENIQIKDSKAAIAIFENVISAIEAAISASEGEENPSKENKKTIKANKEVKKYLKGRLRIFGKIDDFNYEPKKALNHDLSKLVNNNQSSPANKCENKTSISISFDSDNETKCHELRQRLEDKFKLKVGIINMEKDSLEKIFQALKENVCILMSVTKKNERDLIGAMFIKKKATKIILLDESDFEEVQKLKEKIDKKEAEGESMNEEQMNAWFERNKLDSALKELASNGQMLKQLWDHKQNNPEFFTQELKAKLENKPNHEELIKQFSLALDKLFSTQ